MYGVNFNFYWFIFKGLLRQKKKINSHFVLLFLQIGSGGITREQYEKLKAQKQQYHEAKQKLEAQLLKLKEQREALKEDGAVHEDLIMKENAKLQACTYYFWIILYSA